MEIKENNNTGLDFLGEKEDENDNNINNNKQTGNLDLLDLNNIFSAASGNNPADINSNNNNQNNNQAGNPFDILNMQLNQNNQNNNQQSNNDINNILNMVIGNNNNIPDNNIENKKPTTEINIMKECFKNDDITMHYNITKKESNNIDGSLYATNNKNIEIIGVKIIFQVQKFVKLNVLSVSGDKLEPNQSLGIKKDFTLTSSEPNKKVTLKIKLQYTINSEVKTEQFMSKNL
jgi:hypothetical protein